MSMDSETVLQTKPNLFTYATSELSQDAFLCWLFEHIALKTGDIAHHVAKRLLEKMMQKAVHFYPQLQQKNVLDEPLKIERQVKQIDVLLTFESNQGEKTYIIIEDKTESGESRKNQLEHYQSKLKINPSTDIIIPVLFKTGYTPKHIQANLAERRIVFIGYEDIYEIFNPFRSELGQDVILNSWWRHFYEKFYIPIENAKTLEIDPTMTLTEFTRFIRKSNYPHRILFNKMTDELFHSLPRVFSTKIFPFQGKGHIDWHYQMSKPNWTNEQKKISINIYFVWDTTQWSCVVKTAPHPYKRRKQISSEEKRAYVHIQDEIKAELRKNKRHNWKITNYYLQIAHLPKLNDVPIATLKTKIKEEILLIADEIDRVLGG